MTGEMAYINQEGLDSNGECWDLHAAIAQACGGELKPFDSYQGPYISIGSDVIANSGSNYRMPIQHLSCVRLWVCANDQDYMTGFVYREDTEEGADFDFYDTESAICAARSLL